VTWHGDRLGYRPSLDGVRAVAILAVLAYHGGTPLNGGFIGVDIFLVLSGFLITTLLIQEWTATSAISLWLFYGRRAKRLLPALFATVALVGCIYAADAGLARGIGFLPAATAVLLYAGNWVNAVNGDTGLGLLNHTWSLAIEEQFYLLWPPVLLLALRRNARPSRIVAALMLVAGISAVDRAVTWWAASGQKTYFRSDARADELLVGCALAVVMATGRGRALTRRLLGSVVPPILAGLCLLALAIWLDWRSGFFYVGGVTLIAACAACLIGHVVLEETSAVARVLAARPLVWIGERSYGLYLYHVPIFFGLLDHVPKHLARPIPLTFLLELLVTFIVAALSYRYLESYFLRQKRYPARFRRQRERDAPLPQATPVESAPPAGGA
jgi:peptidoglycan/LPS O-acetylase OafA/YrhL